MVTNSNDQELLELLALLEEHKTVPITEIEHFIRDCDLKVNANKSTISPVIYYVYCQWRMQREWDKTPPMQRAYFFKQLGKYFKQGWRKEYRRYLVDSPFFKLSEMEMVEALEEAEKERLWRESKRRRKRKRKL